MPKPYRVSKRGKGLAHDARWKHFRAEQRRKERKLVKKGAITQNKPKLSKDPGIPNLYPYKKEILQRLLHDKQNITKEQISITMAQTFNQELTQQLMTNQLVQPHRIAGPEQPDDENYMHEKHMRRSAFKQDLLHTIEQADVVLEILDARDPENTRNQEAEEYCVAKHKPFVLVLNKIDLVPSDVLAQWLEYYKRLGIPALLFKSPQSVVKNSVRYANAATGMADKSACVGMFELKHLLSKLRPGANKIIGCCVGYPNTGKSSVINALANRPACQTAPIPGQTRQIQEIHIDSRIRILDSPGVVHDSSKSVVLREELLADPVGELCRVFGMVGKVEEVYECYELQFNPADAKTIEEVVRDFLVKLGKRLGRVKQGGIVDQEQVAREVIRDWNRGKIRFWRTPGDFPHVRAVTNNEWAGIDADMLGRYNSDVIGHLAHNVFTGVALK